MAYYGIILEIIFLQIRDNTHIEKFLALIILNFKNEKLKNLKNKS